jgi:hypothetical protein
LGDIVMAELSYYWRTRHVGEGLMLFRPPEPQVAKLHQTLFKILRINDGVYSLLVSVPLYYYWVHRRNIGI